MEERRQWQRHIFGLARQIGMVGDDGSRDLHALVSNVCGKESLTEISKSDYLRIVQELEKRSSEPPKAKKHESRSTQGMSEGQMRKVWHLMYELKKFDSKPSSATLGERLCGIIKRELGIDAVPEKPFIWITYQKGSVLIERLKKYVYNAERRAAAVKAKAD